MKSLGTGVHLRPNLLAAGYRDSELRVLRRRGDVVTVRPGAYVPSDDPRLARAQARHLLAVRAAMAALGPGGVVSHVSAAALHGLQIWAVPLQRVHVTRNRRSGARRGRFVHVHAARLEDHEVVDVDGLPVTSLARTVVDVARSVRFESAVVIADGALRGGIVPAELEQAVTMSSHRRGNPAAARVVGFADGRSESVGESRSRVAIARAGLAVPTPQLEVRGPRGGLVGRSDFGWPETATVGEFDGMVKYGRLRLPGETPADAVVREKLREDAIRDTGLRVVRWHWAELEDFGVVVDRLQRAFAAAT